MKKDTILNLLLQAEGYLSGEEISQTLGVSRTSIWKQIKALRAEGYEIEAKTNGGYKLISVPDTPTEKAVFAKLQGKDFCPEIIFLDAVDSTNTYLKQQAESGVQHGTVCIANAQTSGRGRRGRSFESQEGQGLFFSILLRPEEGTLPENLSAITAFAAVAVCDAITKTVDITPKIKWVNDILVDDQKLVGILSELSLSAESGQVDYIVIGVGINVHQRAEDFSLEVRKTATSLDILTGEYVSRATLAANLIAAFDHMYQTQKRDPAALTARYRALSCTIGHDIDVITGAEKKAAHALDIDENCGLLVRYNDGGEDTLHYGEISIRARE